MYIRLSRYETEALVPADIPFRVGEAQVLAQGEGVVFAVCGPILSNVLKATRLLTAQGRMPGIVNFPTLKPFDRRAVENMATRHRHIASVEEHSVVGGLGSAIAECLSEFEAQGARVVLHRLGLQDCFGESGAADELLKKHGLDPDGIAERAGRLFYPR